MQERDSDFFSSTQSMTNQPDNVEETTMPSEQPVQQPLQIEDATFIPETTDTPTGNAGTEEPAMEEQAEQTERSLEEISMADADELDEPKEEEAEQTEASLADAAEIDQPNEDEATNEEETEEETEAVRIKRSGNIFFVGVPIGNDGDITLRAIRTLANADVVVCEEAKVGARIMRTHNISAKLMEMNEHNEEEATEEVIALLNAGKTVAVISDAGLPLVADPGATLVQKLRELKLRPTVIPGVSSITTALMVSGFGIDEFDMVGFLPRKIGERELAARALRLRTRTVVILETPYRLRSLLSILADAMPLRPAALAMNLTMPNEAVLHDTLAGLNERFVEKKFRGEFVVVLGPHSERDEEELELEEDDDTAWPEPATTYKTIWGEERVAEEDAGAETGGNRPIRKRSAERFVAHDDEGGKPEMGQGEQEGERPRRKFEERGDQSRPRRSSEARNDDRRPYGDRPRRNFNDRNDGDRPRRNFGDRSFGKRDDDRRPFGDRPRRDFNDRNDGDRPRRNFNDRNDGERPRRNFNDRNDGERPRRNFGERSFGKRDDDRRPFGDRPRRDFNDRNDGDRPRRNFNDRNDGERPRRNFNDRNDSERPRRDFGERSFGKRDDNRRPFGDRRNDGERPRRDFNKGFGGGRPGGGKKFGGKR